MSVPPDIEKLSALLPNLGIEREFVRKAVDYLLVDPENEQRWAGIAIDYREASKLHAADAVFRIALERFPNSAALAYTRGELLRIWQKMDGARALHSLAHKLDPEMPHPMLGLGKLYMDMQDYSVAVDWYRKHLERRPDHVVTHNNLANCYLQLGDYDAAERHYKAALDLDPDHTDALLSYAGYLYLNREFDHALKHMDHLLAVDPSDEEARSMRKEIARRPEQLKPIGVSNTRHNPIMLRGSVNYGWEGSAEAPQFTLTTPDLTKTSIIELNGRNSDSVRSDSGYLAADLVDLERHIEQVLAEGQVPDVSDKVVVFLSYRRDPPEHIDWVRAFATALAGRGYEVAFDEFISREAPEITVPALVSQLAACNLFVPIITDEYTQAVEPDDMYTSAFVAIGVDDNSWAYDEMRVARRLVQRGMRCLPLWQSGTMLPSPFYEGNMVDVRTQEGYAAMLDHFFPPA